MSSVLYLQENFFFTLHCSTQVRPVVFTPGKISKVCKSVKLDHMMASCEARLGREGHRTVRWYFGGLRQLYPSLTLVSPRWVCSRSSRGAL